MAWLLPRLGVFIKQKKTDDTVDTLDLWHEGAEQYEEICLQTVSFLSESSLPIKQSANKDTCCLFKNNLNSWLKDNQGCDHTQYLCVVIPVVMHFMCSYIMCSVIYVQCCCSRFNVLMCFL